MAGNDSLYIDYMKTAKAPVTISTTTLAVFAGVVIVLILVL